MSSWGNWGYIGQQFGAGLGAGIVKGQQDSTDKTILNSILNNPATSPTNNPLGFYEAVMKNPDLSNTAKQEALQATHLGISQQNEADLQKYRQSIVDERHQQAINQYNAAIAKMHKTMVNDLATTYFPKIAKNGALWLRDNYPAIKAYLQTKYPTLAADMPNTLSLQEAVQYYNMAKTWKPAPKDMTPYQKKELALQQENINLRKKADARANAKVSQKQNETGTLKKDLQVVKDALIKIKSSNALNDADKLDAAEKIVANAIAFHPNNAKTVISLYRSLFPKNTNANTSPFLNSPPETLK